MRAVGAIFPGDPQLLRCPVDHSREPRQRFAAFHANPENARRSWRREKAGAGKADVERLGLDRGQRALDLLHLGIAHLAYELERDVHALGAGPAGFRSTGASALHELDDARANLAGNVESDENAHIT